MPKKPPKFKVKGPRGTVAAHATGSTLTRLLPRWLRRYRRVTVEPAAKQPNRKPPKPGPTRHEPPSKRAILHSLMVATTGNPYRWRYREVRPLKLPKKLARGVVADCSFAVKILCRWAGLADDPTGEHWTGWGNSTTIYKHLPKLAGLDNAEKPTAAALKRAQVGDILLFGPDGAWHATMIQEAGPDPLLWSHGHQGAPNSYRLSDDKRRPISVCRLDT